MPKILRNINEIVGQIQKEKLLTPVEDLSKNSQYILFELYKGLQGPYKKTVQSISSKINSSKPSKKELESLSKLKSPLIISFHPKLSLLNNNIHEALMATIFAEKLNCIPLWIPYVYDTATHSASEGGKIRAPTYAFIESDYIPLRTSSQIHGNIIKTEKSINDKEINKFLQTLENHLIDVLGNLKRHLNPYNFGHSLFDLKLKVMEMNKKKIRKILEPIKKIMTGARKNTKSLGEYLGKVSLDFFKQLGIPINLSFIEDSMPTIVKKVFGDIIKKEQVKKNPALLEQYFVHYDIKEKIRTPIQFTGEKFLAYDDSANRLFDGTIEDLCEGLSNNYVLPTGPALILLFISLGGRYTLGGLHTQEYYPEYINDAHNLLEGTEYNSQMQVIGYGQIRSLEVVNMTDIMATSRILEKIGSRTIVSKGAIEIPRDIVDQVNFLAGRDKVPIEFHPLLDEILKKQKVKDPAIEREEERYKLFNELNKIPVEELPKYIDKIQPYYRKVKLSDVHPERIKMAVESLYEDSVMRVEKIKENIFLDLHLLGGTLEVKQKNDEDFENEDDAEGDNLSSSLGISYDDEDDTTGQFILFGGQHIRSKRVPTLLEMALYHVSIDNNFIENVKIIKAEDPVFPFLIVPESFNEKEGINQTKENDESDSANEEKYKTLKFTNYQEAFNHFSPAPYLPKFFQPKK